MDRELFMLMTARGLDNRDRCMPSPPSHPSQSPTELPSPARQDLESCEGYAPLAAGLGRGAGVASGHGAGGCRKGAGQQRRAGELGDRSAHHGGGWWWCRGVVGWCQWQVRGAVSRLLGASGWPDQAYGQAGWRVESFSRKLDVTSRPGSRFEPEKTAQLA